MTHTLLFDPNTGATQDDAHAQLAPQWLEQLEQVMQQDRNFFLQHPETDYPSFITLGRRKLLNRNGRS